MAETVAVYAAGGGGLGQRVLGRGRDARKPRRNCWGSLGVGGSVQSKRGWRASARRYSLMNTGRGAGRAHEPIKTGTRADCVLPMSPPASTALGPMLPVQLIVKLPLELAVTGTALPRLQCPNGF